MLTSNELSLVYNHLNEKIWQGKLPPCHFIRVGDIFIDGIDCGAYVEKNSSGYVIALHKDDMDNCGFWWIVSAMIHEMTHLYIMHKGDLQEKHGRKFARCIRRFTEKYLKGCGRDRVMDFYFEQNCFRYYKPIDS